MWLDKLGHKKMRVKFDYLQGPVMGHKRRCELLIKELVKRGHEIVTYNPDWLIVDYPEKECPAPTNERRLVMGMPPQNSNDWAWMPLTYPRERAITGAKYLIIDPLVGKYRGRKGVGTLLTCGGADPNHFTEAVLAVLGERNDSPEYGYTSTVVIGPNFKRDIAVPKGWKIAYHPSYENLLSLMSEHGFIICAWGTTVFESVCMGKTTIPIAQCDDHVDEARFMGMAALTRDTLDNYIQDISQANKDKSFDLGLRGAEYTCKWLEEHV
jgi:spore coat polysaccharide biosynthesis predicted glycosyltransferase SpsG